MSNSSAEGAYQSSVFSPCSGPDFTKGRPRRRIAPSSRGASAVRHHQRAAETRRHQVDFPTRGGKRIFSTVSVWTRHLFWCRYFACLAASGLVTAISVLTMREYTRWGRACGSTL